MVGWATMSETAICLECHRSMDFKWRVSEDGKFAAIAPAHEVNREPDAQRAEVLWVTLQMRCRCGATLGILVDVAPPSPSTAAG